MTIEGTHQRWVGSLTSEVRGLILEARSSFQRWGLSPRASLTLSPGHETVSKRDSCLEDFITGVVQTYANAVFTDADNYMM